MRWLRRIGIGLALIAIGTSSCAQGVIDGSGRRGVPYRQASPGPFIETAGVQTRYERWGTTGSPIVLVHGFIESTYAWRPVAERLARDHVVYALDLRGFGFTERRGPYGLEGWTRQLQAFLAALAIDRPLLVGHSLGAAVVAEVARLTPDAVAGIVLADGDARKRGAGPPAFVRNLIRDPWFAALFRIATRRDWAAAAILPRVWGPNPPAFDHAAIAPWLDPFRVEGAEEALRELAHQPVAGLDDDKIATIRTPALVLWGAHDDNVPLASGREVAGLLRARVVILADAGHLSMLADPAGFARSIEEFAATLSAR